MYRRCFLLLLFWNILDLGMAVEGRRRGRQNRFAGSWQCVAGCLLQDAIDVLRGQEMDILENCSSTACEHCREADIGR